MDWWKKRFDQLFQGEFTFEKRLDKDHCLVKHTCGNKFETTTYNFTKNNGAKAVCECQRKKTGPKERLDKEWQNVIDDIYGKGEYKLGKRIDYYNRIVKHRCGEYRQVNLKIFARKNGRQTCSCIHKKRVMLTRKLHQQDIDKSHNKEFVCFKFDPNKECTYQHTCGYKWKTTWRSFRLSTHCPACKSELIKEKTQQDILKRIEREHGKNEYKILEFLDDEKGWTSHILVKHMCGEQFETSVNAFCKGFNRCASCFGVGIGRPKIVKLNGKEYKCLGAEPLSLKKLVEKWPHTEIITSLNKDRLEIKYNFGKKRLSYFPDFYLPRKNLIVEVKSPATMGLSLKTYQFFPEDTFEKTQAKAKQCKKLGYKFELHLYRNNKVVEVPDGWERMTKRKLGRLLNIKVD